MRLSNACRERGLRPGGTIALMRDRLLRYDCCRSQLCPCETRTDVKAACAACLPPLWAVKQGGPNQRAVRERPVRARLCMYEFAPESLGARDFASFYELKGQYLEVRFDDGSCASHLVWLISWWLISSR